MANSHETERGESTVKRIEQLTVLKNYLRDCLTGYTSSRELCDLCQISERMTRGVISDEQNLLPHNFWETLSVSLVQLQDKTAGLPPVIRESEDLKKNVKNLDNGLKKVIKEAKAKANNTHGAECIQEAKDSLESIELFQEFFSGITQYSRDTAFSILDEMENIIGEIREYLSITDRKAREPSAQPLDVGGKVKEEMTENKRRSKIKVLLMAYESPKAAKSNQKPILSGKRGGINE